MHGGLSRGVHPLPLPSNDRLRAHIPEGCAPPDLPAGFPGRCRNCRAQSYIQECEKGRDLNKERTNLKACTSHIRLDNYCIDRNFASYGRDQVL